MMRYQYGHQEMAHRGLMMIPMAIICMILLIIFIYFIVRIIKHIHKHGHVHGHFYKAEHNAVITDTTSKAMVILNERFAKGEIAEEEYNSKKEQILK